MSIFVLGLATKLFKKGPMCQLPAVFVSEKGGLAGDCRGNSERLGGTKQVTVISRDQWVKVWNVVRKYLHWTDRRANIYVGGIVFGPEHLGKRLYIGREVILEVTGETTPCGRMDEACPGLQAALAPDWRGGVTCRVIREGVISVNDGVICE